MLIQANLVDLKAEQRSLPKHTFYRRRRQNLTEYVYRAMYLSFKFLTPSADRKPYQAMTQPNIGPVLFLKC